MIAPAKLFEGKINDKETGNELLYNKVRNCYETTQRKLKKEKTHNKKKLKKDSNSYGIVVVERV